MHDSIVELYKVQSLVILKLTILIESFLLDLAFFDAFDPALLARM